MPYIGNQPGTGVRSRFIYTATASQTTFSGADDNSKTLKYADSAYVDVFLNGVCLVPGTDYTANTKTSIVLITGASASDTLEVIAYDVASMDDSISESNGGTFQADVTFADGADILTASKGTGNVRIGENAGNSILSGGDNNVTIGKDAGTAITTGIQNTIIGGIAGDALDSDYNVAVGYGALSTETLGARNTAIGQEALGSQNSTSATQSYNTAVGMQAGRLVTTGTRNTFVGSLSGDNTDDGSLNTAVGYLSLTSNCGNKNTAVGALAGQGVTGINNTVIGEEAGILCTGDGNTFVGAYNASSGGSGEAMTTGDKNTIIGAFNGNQNGLDIRTSDKRIVISDGDAKPRIHSGQSFFRVGNDQSMGTTTDTSGADGGIIRAERDSMSGNADDFKTSGFYRFDSGSAGLPTSTHFYSLVIFGNSSNVVAQIAVQLQSTVSYVRAFNSAWSSWARLDT